MSCVDPERSRLLLPYELRRLSAEEEALFEAHLLECDACFEDLRSISRVGAVLRRHVEGAPAVLRTLRAAHRRRRSLAVAGGLLLAAAGGFLLFLLVAGGDGNAGAVRVAAGLARAHLEREDISAAEDAVERALELSPSDPEALWLAARVTARRDRPEEALDLIRRAQSGCGNGPTPLLCRILMSRAAIEILLGLPEVAVGRLERAARCAEALREPGIACRAWTRRARCQLTRLLDREGSRRSLDRAQAVLGPAPRGMDAIVVERMELLLCILGEGEYERGLRRAERIQDLAREIGGEDACLSAFALSSLGVAREALAAAGVDREENLRRARRLVEEALELRRGSRNLAGISRSHTQLGRIGILEADLDRARISLEEAASIRRYRGDARGQAATRANLALVRLLEGDPAGALDLVEPVVARAERSRDPFLLFVATALRGRALLALGRESEAREALARALEVGERLFPTPIRVREIALLRRLLGPATTGLAASPYLAMAIRLY